MNRRGFLQGILAAGVAPAFVGSGVLMPVKKILTPALDTSVYLVRWGEPLPAFVLPLRLDQQPAVWLPYDSARNVFRPHRSSVLVQPQLGETRQQAINRTLQSVV